MTDRLPWDPRTTLLAAAGAFAAGVQVRLLLRSGFASYPPAGAQGIAWSTLLLLVGVVMVAASRAEPRAALARVSAAAEAVAAAGEAAASTWAGADAASGGQTADPEPESEPRDPAPQGTLDVGLESPFDEAPAVAPGEDVPVRVHVDAAGLDGTVRLRLAVREGESRRVRNIDLDGSTLARSVTFTEPGPVEVAATVDHPRAEAATARAQGRCQPYREAVGDVLDTLREAADRRGLDAGPGSTPRQTCRAFPAGPTDDLRDRLEAALYGDEAVPRDAYLAIHRLHKRVLGAQRGKAP